MGPQRPALSLRETKDQVLGFKRRSIINFLQDFIWCTNCFWSLKKVLRETRFSETRVWGLGTLNEDPEIGTPKGPQIYAFASKSKSESFLGSQSSCLNLLVVCRVGLRTQIGVSEIWVRVSERLRTQGSEIWTWFGDKVLKNQDRFLKGSEGR